MWLRRVKPARGLQVRVAPRTSRACTALLSTSRCLAQIQSTKAISSTTVQHETTTQQERVDYRSSLSADMRDARQLLSEKFNIHSLEPDEEVLLERLLTGNDVLLQMNSSHSRRALQLVSMMINFFFIVYFGFVQIVFFFFRTKKNKMLTPFADPRSCARWAHNHCRCLWS